MSSRYRMLSCLWTAALLLVASPALACPYCVGRDKDGIATPLIIAAMVMVPYVIVAVTGVLIRRANQVSTSEPTEVLGSTKSEVC